MKKLIFGAVFALVSVTALSSFTIDKEIESTNIEENITFFKKSCRRVGDAVYRHARSTGSSHRQARSARREFIRGCNAN